jgi:hypothetical protein
MRNCLRLPGRLRFGLACVDAGEAGVEHREVRFEQRPVGLAERSSTSRCSSMARRTL